MSQIALIVPTCREEQIKKFKIFWKNLITTYNLEFIIVHDGDDPWIELCNENRSVNKIPVKNFMGKYVDVISNHISAVRNAGIAFAYQIGFDIFITVDDDCYPIENQMGDSIGEHLKVLDQKVPISWMPIGTQYTRGFPYGVRQEAEVVLSHGVWEGIFDYDAATQLVCGNLPMDFYKMAIPKGVYFPMSGMNLAWKRKATPYMYWAQREDGIARFDDIFMGITAKREFDKLGWACVTGCSKVTHNKMSNVYSNLEKEAVGIRLNETFWQGDETHPYFKRYRKKLKRWQEFLKTLG